jgi:hypothetical protein
MPRRPVAGLLALVEPQRHVRLRPIPGRLAAVLVGQQLELALVVGQGARPDPAPDVLEEVGAQCLDGVRLGRRLGLGLPLRLPHLAGIVAGVELRPELAGLRPRLRQRPPVALRVEFPNPDC